MRWKNKFKMLLTTNVPERDMYIASKMMAKIEMYVNRKSKMQNPCMCVVHITAMHSVTNIMKSANSIVIMGKYIWSISSKSNNWQQASFLLCYPGHHSNPDKSSILGCQNNLAFVTTNLTRDMDYMDIESFRSKYSDITVTAVPSANSSFSTGSTSNKIPKDETKSETNMAEQQQEEIPRVEITCVVGAGAGAGVGTNPPPQPTPTEAVSTVDFNSAAAAYANEYKQVMDKLEHTRYMQAQLQLLTLGNGGKALDNLYGLMPSAITIDPTTNVVDKYSNLLALLAGMKGDITPTVMGARGPRDRLLRDIAHARILIRELVILTT